MSAQSICPQASLLLLWNDVIGDSHFLELQLAVVCSHLGRGRLGTVGLELWGGFAGVHTLAMFRLEAAWA